MKLSFLNILLFVVIGSLHGSCTDSKKQSTMVDNDNDQLYVFLCLGQSNMEGSAKVEAIDTVDINDRLIVMQTIDCPEKEYVKGQWRKAIPPLVRCYTGLSPADYFGRTLVDSLPDHIQIGIINVAIGGCRIELFDKDNYQAYVDSSAAWLKNMVNEYDGNPYQRLIEMAQLAQQDGGIIKGVLLHQGESNAGERDWPLKVKKVYDNILADLDLAPNSIPILAGEMVSEAQNGICYGMNETINTLPQFIDNAYIISSAGCEGVNDRLHFSAAGYRKLGNRYALQMLDLLNIKQ